MPSVKYAEESTSPQQFGVSRAQNNPISRTCAWMSGSNPQDKVSKLREA